ncbi:MAG: 50S ribosomal protein L11 methyltransferase [Gammaproteobacteria bacterium AqS3]|nr:50S ribosomal protein L11 methyltransferase [Gammaproteobacteria bacterium AqS3]
MAHRRIRLQCDRDHVPPLEALLEGAGCVGLSMSAAAGEPPALEAGGAGRRTAAPDWHRVELSALFSADTEIDPVMALLHETGLAQRCRSDVLTDADWQGAVRERTRALSIAGRLWIVPGNCRPPAGASGENMLRLDPGLAFGSGEHPTTQLCLEWLVGLGQPPGCLVDYGCGSGVLALTAARLGSARVIAVDSDPFALDASRENALANALPIEIECRSPQEAPSGAVADAVIANILPGALIELRAVLLDLLKPGGRLALSGILAGQADRLLSAYGDAVDFAAPIERDGWLLLHGSKR